VAEEGRTVPDRGGPEAGSREAELGATEATETGRVSRLRRRLGPWSMAVGNRIPISIFTILTTDKIQRALALT
jgi:hypothetical protein